MDSEELIDFVRKEPFRPYRITLADGTTYDVDHPDLAAIGRGSVIVGIKLKRKRKRRSMRDVLISLAQIIQVEFIETSS